MTQNPEGDLWTAQWWTLGDTPGGAGACSLLLLSMASSLSYSHVSWRLGGRWGVLNYGRAVLCTQSNADMITLPRTLTLFMKLRSFFCMKAVSIRYELYYGMSGYDPSAFCTNSDTHAGSTTE